MCVLLTGRGYLHTVSTHISMLIYTLASTQPDSEHDLGSSLKLLFIELYFLI